ncbi:unnamed protein product [Strongylus vulgaris]|uniref:Ig-like domain-containing protein n=1 Tax=Strongylus vulgaris TaxID=40348 RepID=A0A3P7JIB1_STRVU|nr:unnamed protein product [Strongylus vulgaris]
MFTTTLVLFRSPDVLEPRSSPHKMQAQLTTCASLLESPLLQFEQGLEDVEATYGDSLTLTCSIYGAPQAAITWLHRGRVVATHLAPTVESALHTTRIASGLIETRYTIPCVNRKTLGEYTCQASSPCGEVISSSAVVGLSNTARGMHFKHLNKANLMLLTKIRKPKFTVPFTINVTS